MYPHFLVTLNIYPVLNEPTERVLGVRIGEDFAVLRLGATMSLFFLYQRDNRSSRSVEWVSFNRSYTECQYPIKR